MTESSANVTSVAAAVASSSNNTSAAMTTSSPHEGEFYLRYYVGHKGRFGHEFMEFELSPSGKLRYANNSNYKHDSMIRKEVYLSPAVVDEFQRIIRTSQIRSVDDQHWKEPSLDSGRQELEIKMGNEHIAFTCAEIGSLAQVEKSADPEGLKAFYFLTQDLKCLVLSLISMHFKVKPIPTWDVILWWCILVGTVIQSYHLHTTCIVRYDKKHA